MRFTVKVSDHVKEDYSSSAVPSEKRRPLYEILLNLSGGPVCVAALFAGASLASSNGFYGCLTAVLIGAAILVCYGALIGSVGMRSGCSTVMLVERSFGALGSKAIAIVIAVCLTGWYAVQTGFFGETLHAMFPNGGFWTQPRVAAFWGGLLMLSTAFFGYRGLSILSIVAVPFLLILSLWGSITAVPAVNLQEYQPKQLGTLGDAITMVVGALAVGATVTPDITRYAKSSGHTWLACFGAYFVVNAFMLLSGVVAVIATGSGNYLTSMVALGLGLPALAILVLGQWTTNDDNLYSASLGISGAMPHFRKHLVVLVLGVLATLSACAGIANKFVPFLIMLGVTIPPIGGILLVDGLLGLRNQVEADLNSAQRRKIGAAFFAWGCGITVGFLVQFGIPAINSIIIAGVIYAVLRKALQI